MSAIPLDDPSLFGNDAGEDENESVLMSYFVDRDDFKAFLDPRAPLAFTKGRKGMGKSALLVRFAHDQRVSPIEPSPLIIQLIPARLIALKKPPETQSHPELMNYWQQVICSAINMQLARDIGFAWKDDHMALVESAEVAGFLERGMVASLLARFAAKFKLGAIEIAPTAQPINNNEELLSRIRQEQNTRRPVWFLLDDIDAKFENTPAQRKFVSAFFSACRELARRSDGIGIRATVRTDVWTNLRAEEDLDKCEQYVTPITWSATQQESILTHRVLGYVKRTAPASAAANWTVDRDAQEILNLVFIPRMRWGRATVPAVHVLRILAGGRPRWIAQLCRMAGRFATHEKHERIALHHVKKAMPEFGKRRLDDLYKEHQYQFDGLKALLESFGGGPSNFTSDALLRRIDQRYVRPTGKVLDVPPIDSVDYSDTLQLARFLFKIGFISACNAEYQSQGQGASQFLNFEERPDLLEVETNLDGGMSWEVHPAYRNVLNIQASPRESADSPLGG